ncbi:MAG: metallophosphoesterase family protein [Planctomycetota bacterium]
MRRLAIISDIHGNLHALQAVFRRLEKMSVDGVVCLGDIVGYGPYPSECLDLITKYCSIIVQGNHDLAAVDPHAANSFNGAAREAIYWTRDRISPLHLDALNRMRTIEYFDERIMCVHDCPVPGPTDYVHDRSIASIAFRGVDAPLCLLGHTHVPMVFETSSDRVEDDLRPGDVTAHILRDGVDIEFSDSCRYIANPGSVGQPRDCDPRASFALLDLEANTFTVHREAYDVAAAQLATQRAGLPTVLAARLAIGA